MSVNDTKDVVMIEDDEYQVTENDEIAAIDYELQQIESELQKLQDRKKILTQRKEKLRDDALLKKSFSLSKKNWNNEEFDWSAKLKKALKDVFKIDKLRELQLPTMNAIMSKEDVILIMPTGGGKSLCYQLPAVISKGITIVVSPLVSLMEDQLHGLHKFNVKATMLCAKADKESVKMTMNALADKKSDLKLIYVTPEYMAKSNRFMSKLQKAYELGHLERFAIDEVHCCSQWGHDFRPDYKFLGVLKSMFQGIPILGLTATAPAKIIVDVQKMLDISGCLVLRASFNRPNLYYEVLTYCLDQTSCRRSLIATHFEETWNASDCVEMCDHCRKPNVGKEVDIGQYCRQLYQIMTKAVQNETRLTALKLVDAWYSKGSSVLRVSTVPVPRFARETAEAIVGHLLANGYLQEDFHFSAYSTISYLKRGPKSGLALNNDHKILFNYELH
ncbi:ATP-dependent DNA helicase Q1 [Camponotus floridanus]|uniref:ATP-dependent DNA helicase n=1 Tax=Camponotus floridanus TaxID=104421 RepID=E2AFQ8_CAMFO|nr:ATP-dependent DNA helicase Q1 [Camponotus floridanus]